MIRMNGATQRHAALTNGQEGSAITCAASLTSHTSEAGASPEGKPISNEGGDVLYGAKAIARFLFGAEGSREQRRVFLLWSHYQHRPERAGFFKLKGAVCLSKSRWRAFQG